MNIIKELKREFIRDEVLDFAVLMEAVLRRHDKKKGTDWGDDECYFLSRLQEETKELENQIYNNGGTAWNEQAALEAVDVANFAMMIASCYQDSRKLVKAMLLESL